jgi:hypothetical protein
VKPFTEATNATAWWPLTCWLMTRELFGSWRQTQNLLFMLRAHLWKCLDMSRLWTSGDTPTPKTHIDLLTKGIQCHTVSYRFIQCVLLVRVYVLPLTFSLQTTQWHGWYFNVFQHLRQSSRFTLQLKRPCCQELRRTFAHESLWLWDRYRVGIQANFLVAHVTQKSHRDP